MCDYCDCRSTPEIGELSGEHEVLLHLLRELGDAVRWSAVPPVEVVARLQVDLAAHARREERGVFAGLRAAAVSVGYVERFEADHGVIDGLLGALHGPSWASAAGQLIRLLSDHIAREEFDLYPAAHQLLDDAQWATIHRT